MDAIENKEGATLASLLSVTAPDNRQRIAQAFRANPRVRQILRWRLESSLPLPLKIDYAQFFCRPDVQQSKPLRFGASQCKLVTCENPFLCILANIDEGQKVP
jgi:hypothetical protein